jgi:hypothetical protein
MIANNYRKNKIVAMIEYQLLHLPFIFDQNDAKNYTKTQCSLHLTVFKKGQCTVI